MIVNWQHMTAMDILNGLAWVILVVFLIRYAYKFSVSQRNLRALNQRQKELDQAIDAETRHLKQLVDAFKDHEDPDES
jgi:hypothetical protein